MNFNRRVAENAEEEEKSPLLSPLCVLRASAVNPSECWRTTLPVERVRLVRGRMERGQAARALSLAVRHPRDLPETRAAFRQFDDAELVLLVHPENHWAILARRQPAPNASAKIQDLARVRLARNTAPFVARNQRRI